MQRRRDAEEEKAETVNGDWLRGPIQQPPDAFCFSPRLCISAFKNPAAYFAKNGLFFCSSPTVVSGPWPGQMTVFPGSVRICSMLFFNASA